MKNMAMPAANHQTAGMKKPTVNAADTARVGITKVSEAIMNETQGPINGLDITVAAALSEFEEQCMHEFFDLALRDNRVSTLCEVIGVLVDRLGGIGQVPATSRYAVFQALATNDVLAVQQIQWFPVAKGGQQ